MKRKIENILLSWDTFGAISTGIVTYIFTPATINNKICYSIYGMAINVLAIVFSIFFASLAVIMSFPDNEFIKFIEKPDKLFSKLLRFFGDTLFALFVALLFTIAIYIISIYRDDNAVGNKILFVIFTSVFAYSLIATIIAVDVALKITSSRATYLTNLSDAKEEVKDQSENSN